MSLGNIFLLLKIQAVTINILLEKFAYCHLKLKIVIDFYSKYIIVYDYLYLFVNKSRF